MPSHVETMEVLWKLVELDAQLVRNGEHERRTKADFAKAEKAVNDAHKAHIAAQAAVNKARAEQKAAEDELRRLEQRIERLEAGEVKIAPDALEKERTAVDELETRGIELLEVVQAAETAELKARHDALAADTHLQAARDIAVASLDVIGQEAKALHDLRAASAAPLSAAVMDVYESANRANPGTGLCRIADRLCGGCGGELTLQHVLQVKGRNEIVRCPNCARIQDIPLTAA